MSGPKHHAGIEALLDFTTGSAPAGLGLAIACHLSFCADCCSAVRDIESLTDTILADDGPDPGRRASLLRQLDHAPTPLPVPARPDPRLLALGLPPVLRRCLPPESAQGGFRFLLPGVAIIDLVLDAPGTRARLMRFQPGVVVPAHDHAGSEYAVVLRGSFHDDEEARFGPGDLCVREPGAPHRLRIDPAEVCVALVVNHGRMIPHTLLGRLLTLVRRM